MADDDSENVSSQHEPSNKNPPAPQLLWQTTVREGLTPYLPSPIVQAIQRVDPQLAPYVGSEATVTLITTLLVGFVVLKLLQLFSSRGIGRDKDDAVKDVLLIGPSGSGKTRLFYQLCYGRDYAKIPTLASLQPNVGHATVDDDSNSTIRYTDWPGVASLDDPALESLWRRNSNLRIVLVLDATQPVAAAADILYHALSVRNSNTKKQPPIFVACHKTDFPKAKNWRRIKTLMRTELERLLKVAPDNKGNSNIKGWMLPGNTVDMEALPVHFCSTSSEGLLSPELQRFCQTGEISETAK